MCLTVTGRFYSYFKWLSGGLVLLWWSKRIKSCCWIFSSAGNCSSVTFYALSIMAPLLMLFDTEGIDIALYDKVCYTMWNRCVLALLSSWCWILSLILLHTDGGICDLTLFLLLASFLKHWELCLTIVWEFNPILNTMHCFSGVSQTRAFVYTRAFFVTYPDVILKTHYRMNITMRSICTM